MGVPILLFVPALAETDNQTAARIAELAAQFASKARHGTYTVRMSPSASSATVCDPGGTEVLRVTLADYRKVLLARQGGGADATPRGVLTALWFAITATGRLIYAWKRHAKSGRAKLQIFIATGGVILLYMAFLLVLIGFLAVLGVPWVPDWLKTPSSGQKVFWGMGFGSLLAYGYWRVRPRLIRWGITIRSLMGYLGHDPDRRAVTAVIDEALDQVMDDSPGSDVHILGYSFGSVVLMDALIPHDEILERRSLASVKSITTVGYPADFVRLLYGHHFESRQVRDATIPWVNVFIPADVLGSNLLDGKTRKVDADTAKAPGVEADAPPNSHFLAGYFPEKNIAVGPSVVKRSRLLVLEGFSIHAAYWARQEPRYLEPVIPLWLPRDPAGATLTQATAAEDTLTDPVHALHGD